MKELLQASLQPRTAMEPIPRLISLALAAADMGCIVDVEELRRPLPRGAAPQQRAGIARDPTLSIWQGKLAAEEAQHSGPAAQQIPVAKQSREGAAVPINQQSRTEACSSSPSKNSTVKRSVAASWVPRRQRTPPVGTAAAVNDRENAGSPPKREVLFGQKPVHGRLLWKVERRRPLDMRCLGSLHSAPSTPLSPTNASMAPTRRLPQSERADSGAYAKV